MLGFPIILRRSNLFPVVCKKFHFRKMSIEAKLPIFGVAQLTSINNKEANFEACAKVVAQAKEQGVSFLSLPECFAFVGTNEEETRSNAEPLDGPLMQKYLSLAKDNAMWLSLGGFHEKVASTDRIHNTHLIVSPLGEIEKVYRKIHLFDINIPNGPVMQESKVIAPGDKMSLYKSPFGNVGMSVCYDVRFPELYTSLRHKGAQIILIPAAFTVKTGAAHWKTLLQARAIETQCYVLAAAQVGWHHPKRASYGHAMIIDPWGTIVAEVEKDEPGLATAPIDMSFLEKVRINMPVLEHRRAELYSMYDV